MAYQMFNSWTLFGDYSKWQINLVKRGTKRKDNTEARDTIDANHKSTYQ